MSQADVVASRPLPPGLGEAQFARAIDAFTAALGAEKVLTADEDLREFRDPFQHATWDEYTASAVVMPTSVEEVQDVGALPTSIASRCGRTAPAATTATADRRRACAAR
jgi:hypothetical protein